MAIDGVDHEVGGAADLEGIAGAEACVAVGQVGLARQPCEAAVDDAIADRAQQMLAAAFGAVGFGLVGAVGRDDDPLGQGRVKVDIDARAIVQPHGAGRGLGRAGCGRPVVEMFVDGGIKRARIDIADDDQRGLGGHVIAPPEGAQGLGRGGV